MSDMLHSAIAPALPSVTFQILTLTMKGNFQSLPPPGPHAGAAWTGLDSGFPPERDAKSRTLTGTPPDQDGERSPLMNHQIQSTCQNVNIGAWDVIHVYCLLSAAGTDAMHSNQSNVARTLDHLCTNKNNKESGPVRTYAFLLHPLFILYLP